MRKIDFYRHYDVYKNKKILTVKNKRKPCSGEKLLNKLKNYKEIKLLSIDKWQNKKRKPSSLNKK